MNYKMVLNVVGKTMILEAMLMLAPMFVGIYYNENSYLNYLIPIAVLLLFGLPLALRPIKDRNIYAKEGFVIVALCWITLSLIGALPFVIAGESGGIPNYFDALFETVSGFSTTGASVLPDVEVLSKSIMFWRILTHFLGGMGVLVFVLAVLPSGNGGIMYIFRAESPGPSASKFVGKIKNTARILYAIYIFLTALLTVLLLLGGIGLYDSLLTALSVAGTGGFGVHNGSIAFYNSAYVEIVVSVFMFLYGVNFNVFYLIIIGCFIKAVKSEELITYALIVLLFTFTIAINILNTVGSFGEALRISFFQVSSFISTTGFTTASFENWPALSKTLLLFLTVIGACGGSTGGGMKVSRIAILFKSGMADVKNAVNQRAVVTVKYEGKVLTRDIERGVRSFFILWLLLVCISTLILSLDYGDLFTNLSASITCIGNVGPGLTEAIGSSGSYAIYSPISKIVLSVLMLAGRLEILPIIMLIAPRTWKNL